jgi:dTDP-4-dehydrorhamnose 3,5-epimerase
MQVITTPLKKIGVSGGDVYHLIRSDSPGYKSFGEVYISFIDPGVNKGWKLHKRMTLNLVVPLGHVDFKFELRDGTISELSIGELNYQRITVEPETWFCFENNGSKKAMVINFSDIPHDDSEVVRRD